jgi:RNA polymerase sigma-70 factor (ECF subfamily)
MNASVTVRLFELPALEKGSESQVSDTEVSDEALMQRVCVGDKKALAVLFRRHAGAVRGVAYRVLRDSSEADDLLQDVFLLIYRKSASFDSSKSPARFWILQMTYRCAISRRRYLSSRHFYTRLDLDDVDGELPIGQVKGSAYEDSIEAVLGNGTLERIFENLSDNQRQTLRLFFQEGYTLDEIATELRQSRDNVRHHYFRGLEKLRKQIFGTNPRTK